MRTNSKKSIYLMSRICLLMIALGLAIIIGGCSDNEEPAESDKKVTDSAADILKPENLEIVDLDFSWSEDKLFCYVVGKVNNKTNKHVSSARVIVEYYNAQNEKLAEIKKQIQNIAPRGKGTGGYGGVKKFKLTTQPGIDPQNLDHVKLIVNYVFTY